nr:MAG TPA: hypothetical protein [Caudoviricetes sp.]
MAASLLRLVTGANIRTGYNLFGYIKPNASMASGTR